VDPSAEDPTLDAMAPPWPATEILPGLWQSGHPQPGQRWDAVIDLDTSTPPLEDVDCYVHWPIEDGPAVPDRVVLIALADLVRDLRKAGKQVLVHCAGGINRSGLLAAASLIRDGMSPADAIGTVRSRRPGALTNQAFVAMLERGL
jgi:protein-tyrosine phosphatase